MSNRIISRTGKHRFGLNYSAVSFGKGLKWSFEEIESKNAKINGERNENATITIQ